MIVNFLNTDFVKLFCFGKEKQYLGNKVEYYNETNTFLIFYYSHFTRVYVINGNYKNQYLVQVEEKINKVASYSGKDAKRFLRFFSVYQNDSFLLKLPPLFFRELNILLSHKNYMKKIENLYIKYQEDYKNNVYYPDF